jgi:Zn-dependent M28 family amino/carboxypeptidase
MKQSLAARRAWLMVPIALVVLCLIAISAAWAVVVHMPGHSFRGTPPALSSAEEASRSRLQQTVHTLAGQIGERNYRRPLALDSAERYVQQQFESLGYTVHVQAFHARGGESRNLEVSIPGADRPAEIIVVGAHYDSAPLTPGADDNATGVAALLELARLLHTEHFARTIRFVAFANEEPPYFGSADMGSRFYAATAHARGDSILAMLSLETVGYFSNAPGSQHYPAPFGLVYPTRGNFLTFVGNVASRRLVHESIRAFRASATLPSEGVAAPSDVPGIGWSDHSSFWSEGYPAIMITDTAPFRNTAYHGPHDTPERIDYDALTRATAGITHVVRALANN